MNEKALVILELNVLHILRNRRIIYQLLGMKRTQRVILKNIPSMLGKYVSDDEPSDGGTNLL